MSRIGLLIGLLHPVFLPAASEAQQPKTPRIGYVSNNTASSPGPLVEAFRQGLRELGYTDQRNIVVEYRYAEGNQERIATLVNELVHSSVDLLVIPSGIGAQAAIKATQTIPIVMIVQADPVATGLVDSLARPGGNITDLAKLQRQLSGKRLELLKEAIPRLARVGILREAQGQLSRIGWEEYKQAAESLQIRVHSIELQNPSAELEPLMQTAVFDQIGALITITSARTFQLRKEITELANKRRLPSMFEGSSWVEMGGLMSYSTDNIEIFRRAAVYVDKILKGAKPANLPSSNLPNSSWSSI